MQTSEACVCDAYYCSFFPIFLISRSNDEFERRDEFERWGDDGEPEIGIVVAELEEERWVASGVGILKLSVLPYSDTAYFMFKLKFMLKFLFNFQLMVQKT